jgi:hypothetical protein
MSARASAADLYPPRSGRVNIPTDYPTGYKNAGFEHHVRHGWKLFLIIWIILTLVLWAVLYYGKASWATKVVNGQTVVSGWKAFWIALVIGLILALVFYLLKHAL